MVSGDFVEGDAVVEMLLSGSGRLNLVGLLNLDLVGVGEIIVVCFGFGILDIFNLLGNGSG